MFKCLNCQLIEDHKLGIECVICAPKELSDMDLIYSADCVLTPQQQSRRLELELEYRQEEQDND